MLNAKPVSPYLPPIQLGLQSLTEINAWECEHMPFMRLSSGRALYFALLEQCFLHPEQISFPLKSLTAHLTDKALRIRLQQFVKLGLVRMEECEHDARVRAVTPTKTLMALFDMHATAVKEIFLKRFIYVRRS